MKIKLAILEKDTNYLKKIVAVFGTRYADKIEIYSFSEKEVALANLESAKIDVLVASDSFEIDVDKLPRRCGFAYFVDSAEVDTYNEQQAICKFQKAELIYKQILSVYSENAGNVSGLKISDDNAKVIAFSSAAGGVGTSTMAAACALHYAKQGKKTLYLNLEKYGSSELFFQAEGQFDMSDLIYALKSKKTNLALKLESCVKQDPRGVYFFSQAKLALDMLEVGAEEVIRMLAELKLTNSYEYIIIDVDFRLEEETMKIWRQAHALVWVSDGSECANTKSFRAYQALSTMEQNVDSPLTSRLCVIYNKFSNKNGKVLEAEIRNIGGAPRYEQASNNQIIQQLATMDMFDKIDC